MSMTSFSAGVRYIQLTGGVMTSFYDWYADLPRGFPAGLRRPDRRPESGDWWDAAYPHHVGRKRSADPYPGCSLGLRGPLPRYQGCHRSPDYADNTKFLLTSGCPPRYRRGTGYGDGPRHPPGELRRPACRVLRGLLPTYTDLPSWSPWKPVKTAEGPSKFLTAASSLARAEQQNADFKPVLMDHETG